MTRREKLISLRDTFEDALAGKSDIHDWEARTLSLITDVIPSVEVKHAINMLASGATTGWMRDSNVAKIKSALARAIAEPDIAQVVEKAEPLIIPQARTNSIQPSLANTGPLPAEPDIPKRLEASHGLWWFVNHCHWKARWWFIAAVLLWIHIGLILSHFDFLTQWRDLLIQLIPDVVKALMKRTL